MLIRDRSSEEQPGSLPGQTPATNAAQRTTTVTYVLNALIAILLIAMGYFSSAFIARNNHSSMEDKGSAKPPRIVQLDVLNGCGVKGAGAKFTDYLRTNGFDVVEMKNYKSFGVPQTLVVDRVGDLTAARRVAAALGVGEKNVVQQLNPDYFVDVSIIIGADYNNLRVSR